MNQTKSLRPPIVTIMGHIDHGKTTLLDKIRSTNVWKKEVGGITQHIAGYQALVKQKNGQERLITFIDTPGHAAFSNMRLRGTQVADIVILVISAVDGIMVQTKEIIEYIEKSQLPFIVALNKIDLPGANLDKVKGQLVELGYAPEDYGGQLSTIPVSAKTGEGIDRLLDMILLTSDILELASDDQSPLEAITIESRLDKQRGPVATAIIKKGTMSVGDTIYSGDQPTKVKALVDYTGKTIKSASPSTPVEILGFNSPPPVGGLITAAPILPVLQTASPLAEPPQHTLVDESPKINVVIKADVEGTLEAILKSFPDEVKVIRAAVGPVTDNDVFLAQNSKAKIYCFNNPVPKYIKNLADNSQVQVFETRIIYEIIEDIQGQVLKMLEPTIDETILGEGTIIAEFKINKVRIAGIKVTKGEIAKGSNIHLKRDDKIIKDTKVEGIHQGKAVVDQIKVGSEAGMTFRPYVDFKINDVIISYNK
jgi:translation initiation factor IF-2